MRITTKFALALLLALGISAGSLSSADDDKTQETKKTAISSDVDTASKSSWSLFRPGSSRSIKWRKHKPNRRFRISDSGTKDHPYDDLVLDMETELVWERAPSTAPLDWYEADDHCYKRILNGRLGWRLPSVEELATILDPIQPAPTLPKGHPFIHIQPSQLYWSSSTNATVLERREHAWGVRWDGMFGGVSGGRKTAEWRVWCVRGGRGHDVY